MWTTRRPDIRTGLSLIYLIAFMLVSRIVKASSSKCSLSSLHGRLLLPRDIHFDGEIRRFLTEIREVGPIASPPSSTTRTTTTEIYKGEHFESQSKKLKAALSSLTSAGIVNDFGVTLTLIGYKGGELDEQINQDRAFVLAPFYSTVDDREDSEIGYDSGCDERVDEKDESRLRNSIHDGDDGKNKTNIRGQNMQLMGVMDGHDRLGEVVSEYARREIPFILSSKLNEIEKVHKSLFTSGEAQDLLVQKALTETFLRINATIPTKESGGCTASVLLQINSKVYIANVGDSRTFVVLYYPDTKKVKIVYQTREDKPHLDDEKRRIEQMGGEVYIPSKEMMDSGEDSSRIVIMDRSTGFESSLAMSRSLGDWSFSSAGVIALPIVEVVDLHKFHQPLNEATSNLKLETCQSKIDSPKIFAVAASDGLLDFISPDEMATTLAHSLYDEEDPTPHPATASEQLILKAADKWHEEMGYEYRDDIVISVMKLI